MSLYFSFGRAWLAYQALRWRQGWSGNSLLVSGQADFELTFTTFFDWGCRNRWKWTREWVLQCAEQHRWLLCLPTVWMFHTSQPTDKPILGEWPNIHPLDIVLFIARLYTKKQSLGSTWINYILDDYKMSCGQTIFSAFADFAVSYRENQLVWWIWRNGSWTLNGFEERRGSKWSGPPPFGYLRRSVLGR